MKIIVYLGHPAHFHLFKNVIKILKEKGHQVTITIKSKDVLAELLNNSNLDYINFTPSGRKDNRLSILVSLLDRDWKLLHLARKLKPVLLLGSAAEIAHIGKLLRIPSLVFFEDDLDEVPQFAKLAGPFATDLICPESCDPGKWKNKAVRYNSYHELAYLAPNYFSPDKSRIREILGNTDPFFLIRFAKLTAYHDEGKTGITNQIAKKIINILKPYGRIYISAERELDSEFEQYRIDINPLDMHNVLYFAQMYIGDSQTMTAEAAVLGTPAIRFNDFVGRLGYLEELEHQYNLTYGIKTNAPEKLFDKVQELLNLQDIKKVWESRRQKMLDEKVDLTTFLVWYIQNYPNSKSDYIGDNSIQYKFKIKV